MKIEGIFCCTKISFADSLLLKILHNETLPPACRNFISYNMSAYSNWIVNIIRASNLKKILKLLEKKHASENGLHTTIHSIGAPLWFIWLLTALIGFLIANAKCMQYYYGLLHVLTEKDTNGHFCELRIKGQFCYFCLDCAIFLNRFVLYSMSCNKKFHHSSYLLFVTVQETSYKIV